MNCKQNETAVIVIYIPHFTIYTQYTPDLDRKTLRNRRGRGRAALTACCRACEEVVILGVARGLGGAIS